ncbi:winged helix-turn-helix transcriptional regulator [bacterium]|jgi:ArsR family transcriptional regulator, lead/cadmium/zinc/bismuth-responsive transcriptional repressor|nr:winged helix-turn-helix transcriptional regulator [bacterium]
MTGSENITCDVVCFNQDKIHSIQSSLPQRDELESLAAIHKVLGHPVRLAILEVLKFEQCCVCDLANILTEPVSTISQHLKSLKNLGLLKSSKRGKLVFYEVNISSMEWTFLHNQNLSKLNQ